VLPITPGRTVSSATYRESLPPHPSAAGLGARRPPPPTSLRCAGRAHGAPRPFLEHAGAGGTRPGQVTQPQGQGALADADLGGDLRVAEPLSPQGHARPRGRPAPRPAARHRATGRAAPAAGQGRASGGRRRPLIWARDTPERRRERTYSAYADSSPGVRCLDMVAGPFSKARPSTAQCSSHVRQKMWLGNLRVRRLPSRCPSPHHQGRP